MRFMNAQAFPFDWLEQAVTAYDPAVPLMDSPWYPVLKRQVEEMLETAAALVKQSAGQLLLNRPTINMQRCLPMIGN